MREFRHIGCESVVWRYVGILPLTRDSLPKSADWEMADGTKPRPGSLDHAKCPDCGVTVFPGMTRTEDITGAPFYEKYKVPDISPPPQKQTFFDRLRAVFHF